MKLTAEQEAKFTSGINFFGDAFAQDHNDRRMHEWFVVIRKEMTDEAPPLGHPELRNFLDWATEFWIGSMRGADRPSLT